MTRFAPFLLAAALHLPAVAAPALSPELEAMTQRVSADAMRGHVSFLASDALEGRATPSRGLDIAAEYIASQFRRAGLVPVGDDGYFQTATWTYAERDPAAFTLRIDGAGKPVTVPAGQVSYHIRSAARIEASPVVASSLEAALSNPSAAEGKVLAVTVPAGANAHDAERKLRTANVRAAAILLLDRARKQGDGGNKGWLVGPVGGTPAPAGTPFVSVHAPDAIAALEKRGARVSMVVPAGAERQVKLRNVVGVLPGSDPVLKDTYVILSAHYDHVGVQNGEVFNGANDDASGTASMMEVANAMASLKQRPRRSVLFMAVWGEELGMVGSRYYGGHPVVPIEKTIANLNLEHMGRTDDMEGTRINSASLTGFDYSGVGTVMQQAGAALGIDVYKHAAYSDAFFGRSDNQALADQGVPSHTLCVAFGFPDYHGKDDTWDKIDYDNMARVDRMVALAVHMLADSAATPQWNAANPKVAPYLKAAQARAAALK